MGSCGIWGVPMSRSRSAGIASSSVRSRRCWRVHGVEQAAVIARPGPDRGATSAWSAMSSGQQMMRPGALREAQLVEQWQGVYEGVFGGDVAAGARLN